MRRFLCGFIGLCALVGLGAVRADAQEPSALMEVYQDWTLRCTSSAREGQEPLRFCRIDQELIEQESGQRLFLVAVRQMPDATQRLTVLTPFGLALEQGVALEIGDQPLSTLPFRTCLPSGCLAYQTLTGDLVDQLKAGATLGLRTQTEAGQALSAQISLSGFTAAYDKLLSVSGDS